jgi:hypothetical protein
MVIFQVQTTIVNSWCTFVRFWEKSCCMIQGSFRSVCWFYLSLHIFIFSNAIFHSTVVYVCSFASSVVKLCIYVILKPKMVSYLNNCNWEFCLNTYMSELLNQYCTYIIARYAMDNDVKEQRDRIFYDPFIIISDFLDILR